MFCFLLGPSETENNAYAKFGGTNKEYYGIFENGQILCSSNAPTPFPRFSHSVPRLGISGI